MSSSSNSKPKVPQSQKKKGKGKAKAKKVKNGSAQSSSDLSKLLQTLPRETKNMPLMFTPEGKYAQQLIDPYNTEVELVPDRSDNQMTALKFTRTYAVSSATPEFANGGFAFMSPDLFNPGQITGRNATLYPSIGTDSVSTETGCNYQAGSVEPFNGQYTTGPVASVAVGTTTLTSTWENVPDGFGTNHVAFRQICYPGLNSQGQPLTLDWNVGFKSGKGSYNVIVMGMDAIAGWRQIGTANVNSSTNSVAGQYTPTNPIDAIGMILNSAPTENCHLVLSTTFKDSTFQTAATGGVTFPAFATELIDNQIDKARVTAMSLYFQNTSAAILDNGDMFSGLVPRAEFTLDPLAYQDCISKLPSNRGYMGKTKDGSYVWWQPKDEEELGVNDIAIKQQQYKSSDLIMMGWTWGGAPGTCSALFTATWDVEIHSPKQIFVKKDLPPMRPQFFTTFQALSRFPHAMCNPSHVDAFKNFLASAAKRIRGGYDHYQANKATYDALLTALMGMAAVA